MKKTVILAAVVVWVSMLCAQNIDRKQVVTRNNPHVTRVDPLSSLTVGNGHFAFTVDATGLQTFPEEYAKGVPLCTMSDWGWHSFENKQSFKAEEALVEKDFGRGHKELYSAQFREKGRQQDAANYMRANPHRLHLGCLGLNLADTSLVKNVDQTLDMWTGKIDSRFTYNGQPYHVETVCNPGSCQIATRVETKGRAEVVFRVPYPTGAHSDDAADWGKDKKPLVRLSYWENRAELVVEIDDVKYLVKISWRGRARIRKTSRNEVMLSSRKGRLDFSVQFGDRVYKNFAASGPLNGVPFTEHYTRSATFWNEYWKNGAIADFSHVNDSRARELERRVVLSQYLLAVNDGGYTPPQETGLTYNSWFGKFHLEMIWWHQVQFAIWGHPDLLAQSMDWFIKAAPVAQRIARRQGFKGVRWMKMTDPSGEEAPSNVGSYLIWQQPHFIYLAELIYRYCTNHKTANRTVAKAKAMDQVAKELLDNYGPLVEETAEFMSSFVTLDSVSGRYVLKGCIPAQETLKADSTVNPPFELSYWMWGLQTAQKWRERKGEPRRADWDDIIQRLSPLAVGEDSLYLAAESAPQTYRDIRFTSDHPAVLGAVGMLPQSRLADDRIMRRTLHWIWDNWNWDKTWGWDYPMVAMCAARLGEPERAVDALLMPKRTNTYLVNGHNYQDGRLRVYLPGNGGLLTAVGMMLAGWDGAEGKNPGFPADWDVRWEGIFPMP